MKTKLTLFLFIFFSFIALIKSTDKDQSIKQLKSNLQFLASDELKGREAASLSEKIASLFIAGELNKFGVKPFGDNGTYFQNFNMYVVSNDESNTGIELIDEIGAKIKLNFGDDFVLSKSPLPDEMYSGKNYKVVFAGYGIESEEDNYSDYKNLDVTGKVVVVAPGSPVESQKNVRSYLLKRIKDKIAAQKGAAAIVHLVGKKSEYNWQMVKYYLSSPSFNLESEIGEEQKNIIPSIVITNTSAEKLFNNEKMTFNEIDSVAELYNLRDSFELTKEFNLNFSFNKNLKPARNVVGIIEGTDENFKNEYLTVGAHYDHLGTFNEDVFNGADDNGSGTVAVLELARILAAEKKNKRSIVFAFHTGEEKGLKGAKYLTNNSDELIKNAVVNINLDMIGRESIDTIFTVGSGRLSTELYNLLNEVNSETVNFVLDYKFDSPNDPKNIYNRSDHKHYADKGIPIVFFFDDMTSDYHETTDTIDKINFDKIYKVLELSKALIYKISNLDHRLSVDNSPQLKNHNKGGEN